MFRSNSNTVALNALRQLQGTATSIQKTSERLSSGLRINRAVDDAAGMFIAEQLRGQVATLQQAQRNVAQATSFLQIMEGGMEQLTGILTRLKELGIQAADGAYSDDQRERGIQVEADELISELDRLVESVRFGRTVLFPENEAGITFQVGERGADRIMLSLESLNKDELLDQFATKVGFVLATTALTAAAGFDVSAAGALTANTATEGRLLVESSAGDLVQFSGLEYFISSLTDNDTGQLDMTLEGKLKLSLDSDIVNGAGTKFTKQLRAADTVTMTIDGTAQTFTIASVDSDTQLTLSATVTSAQLGGRGVLKGDGTAALASAAVTSVAVGRSDKAGQYLQPACAQDFLDQISSGIDAIVAQRSRLGAIQGRLERASEAGKLQIENLTEAESVVRDADMAAEISALVRAQVLAQSGVAVLNSANLQPQAVLNLLSAIG